MKIVCEKHFTRPPVSISNSIIGRGSNSRRKRVLIDKVASKNLFAEFMCQFRNEAQDSRR